MLLIAAGLAALPAVGAGEAPPAPLPSVASTNLCADLLLLRLAAPGQVRSVSRQAQDPAVSPLAAQVADLPGNRGGVEELLYLRPDLALVYLGWGARRHAGLLATAGVELVPLPYPTGIDDALTTLRDTAARIGRPQTGAALAADAKRRIAALAASPRPYRALYLRPNGGTAGTGTYVDDLLRLLGLRNVAAEEGIAGWGNLPLERLVLDPPDLFLLGYFDDARPVPASAYARHPRLRALFARTPAITLPGSAWGCGGLDLIDAAEAVAADIAGLPALTLPPP